MDGYEVLLQYDWCGVPMTGGNPQPVAPADPTTACLPGGGGGAGGGGAGGAGGGGGGTPTPTPAPAPRPAPAPASLGALSRTAPVRDGVAGLRVRCLLRVTCSGSVRLLPRGARAGAAARRGRAVVYGSARFRIGAGRRATVGVRLTAAGRRALRRARGGLPVTAAVTTGAGRTTLDVTLSRRAA